MDGKTIFLTGATANIGRALETEPSVPRAPKLRGERPPPPRDHCKAPKLRGRSLTVAAQMGFPEKPVGTVKAEGSARALATA